METKQNFSSLAPPENQIMSLFPPAFAVKTIPVASDSSPRCRRISAPTQIGGAGDYNEREPLPPPFVGGIFFACLTGSLIVPEMETQNFRNLPESPLFCPDSIPLRPRFPAIRKL